MPIKPFQPKTPRTFDEPAEPFNAPSQGFIVAPQPRGLSPSVFDDTEYDDEDPNLKGGGRFQKIMNFLGTGARVAGGAMSNMGGYVGAGIGAGSEAIAQGLENVPKFREVPGAVKDIYRNYTDPYKNEDFDAPSVNKSMAAGFGTEMGKSAARMGVEGAVSAVPMSSTTRVGRGLESFGKSGALAGIGETGREIARGEPINPKAIGLSTLLGGTMGAGLSKILPDVQPPAGPAVFRDGRDLPRLSPKPYGEPPLTPQMAMERGNSSRAASPQMSVLENGGRELKDILLPGGPLRSQAPSANAPRSIAYNAPDNSSRMLKAKAAEDKIQAEADKLARIQDEMEAAGVQPKAPTFSESLTAKSPDGTSTSMRTGFESEGERLARELGEFKGPKTSKSPLRSFLDGPEPVPPVPAAPIVRPVVEPEAPPIVRTPMDEPELPVNPPKPFNPPRIVPAKGEFIADAVPDPSKAAANAQIKAELEAQLNDRRIGQQMERFGGRRGTDRPIHDLMEFRNPPVEPVAPQIRPVVEPEVPQNKARFIGMQEDGDGGGFPMFNVPRADGLEDTWTEATLRAKGIEIPDYPGRAKVEAPVNVPQNVVDAPVQAPVAPQASIPISVAGPQVNDEAYNALAQFFKSPREAHGAQYGQIQRAIEGGAEPKLRDILPISPDKKGRPYTAERLAGKGSRGLGRSTADIGPQMPEVPTGDMRLATVPQIPTDPALAAKNANLRKRLGTEDDFTIADMYEDPNLIKPGQVVPETTGDWVTKASQEADEGLGQYKEFSDWFKTNVQSANRPKVGEKLPGVPRMAPEEVPSVPRIQKDEPVGMAAKLGMSLTPKAPKIKNVPAAVEPERSALGQLMEPKKPNLVKTKKVEQVEDAPKVYDEGIAEGTVPPVASSRAPFSRAEIANLAEKGVPIEAIGTRDPKELRELLSMSTDKAKALKKPLDPKDEAGFASQELMANVAGGAIGGLTGAAMSDDPVLGGLLGATGGIGLVNAPKILKGLDPTDRNSVRDTARRIYEELPHIQRANYLASGHSMAANAVVGPMGSGIQGAIEAGLKGDPRGWAALKMLINPGELKDAVGPAFKTAQSRIEAAERRTLNTSARNPKYDAAVSGPGTLLTTGDETVRSILRKAGFDDDEAKLITMTNEPSSRFGKMMVNAQRTGGPLANLLLPFVRTPMNMLEQGSKRLPGVGAAYQLMKQNPESLKDVAAEQGLSTAYGAVGYGLGAAFPENKTLRRYVSNAGGRNALTANLGYTLGQNSQAQTPNTGNTLARGIEQALSLPQTDAAADYLKLGTKVIGGGIGNVSSKDLPSGMYPKLYDELSALINPATPARSKPPVTSAQRSRLRSIRERRDKNR